MKKIAFFVFFLLFLMVNTGCTSVVVKPYNNTTPDFEKGFLDGLQSKTIVLLDNLGPNSDKKRPICSGVFIGANKILTAEHCIAPAALSPDDYELLEPLVESGELDLTGSVVQFAKYSDYDPSLELENQITVARGAMVVALDRNSDLALLTTSKMETNEWADLSKKEVFLGMPVITVGHPSGLLYSVSHGMVSAKKRNILFEDRPVLFLQTTAPIWFGNSGGPLFDDDGNLIGICSRIAGKSNALGLWVSQEAIKSFLER